MPAWMAFGFWEDSTDADGIRSLHPPGGDAVAPYSSINFRTTVQMQFGGPRGVGLFIYRLPQVHPLLELPIGTDFERDITAVERNWLETRLGLPRGAIREDKFNQVIRELKLSDDDGTGRPLWDAEGISSYFPGSMGRSKGYRFGSHLTGDMMMPERFSKSHPAYKTTIALFQVSYRRLRAAGEDLDHLRQITGGRMRDLGITDSDELLPVEHRSDGWRVPRTIVFDNFIGVNGQPLEDRINPDWTDVVATAGMDIQGNKAVTEDFNTNMYRCDDPVSSKNHSAEISAVRYDDDTSRRIVAFAIRFAAAATDFYSGAYDSNIGTQRIATFIGGAFNSLVTGGIDQFVNIDYKWNFSADDNDDFDFQVDDISRLTLTNNTDIPEDNTRGGIGSTRKFGVGTISYADFRIADSVAPNGDVSNLPQYGQVIFNSGDEENRPRYGQRIARGTEE